ncbi:sensor histidine kinase [Embleya sp. NBC_00896]|uniref:sensor histidine kinase n=1 Tax=Embleya sp. NBC_00896 TaxID=2975961 RepID=UPI002F90AA7A|nr:sensor histidine kinase [Embleya sp. NBC_00896]
MTKGGGGRFGATLRAAPRTLRDDLWRPTYDPLPRGLLDWVPTITVTLVLIATFTGVATVNRLAFAFGLGTSTALLLGGIQAVALVVALFRPVPAWWATTIVTVVVAALAGSRIGHEEWFPWTAAGIGEQAGVLFLLAWRVRPRIAVEALAISLWVGLACTLFDSSGDLAALGRAGLTMGTAVVVGASLRGRRVARTELVEQTELTAEERARRTLLEERNRIARELHDVVAHHMSVISIQAQVAPHLVANPSRELKENLAGIRENAVEALTELRRVLGVLRSEDALTEGARHAPQPTLDRLDELVANVRGAGLTVATEITGERRPLPPGVELSAFRIVQEALSNAIRHAPGAAVRVEVGYHSTGVTVRITNTAPDGPVPPSRGAGHGLLGMRERTAMLGGEFVDGPIPAGGYEVLATLPLGDDA